MGRATFHQENGHFLVDSTCERAILQVTKQYLAFCKAIDIVPPIWLFCSLVDVEGAKYYSRWGGGREGHPIDRPIVELPETELAALDLDVDARLRPLMDCIGNAVGFKESQNYDEHGNRREER